MLKLRVDDPLDAVAVHLCGGLWGVVATPLFARDDGIMYNGSKTAFLVSIKSLLHRLSLFQTRHQCSIFLSFAVSGMEPCWCSCHYDMVRCPVHSHVRYPEWNEDTKSQCRGGDQGTFIFVTFTCIYMFFSKFITPGLIYF